MTFDYANTNRNADFPVITKPLPNYQREVLKREVGLIYDKFLELVADGRGMTTEAVHELAQGRIWNAVDAKENGLIDALGGMENAIDEAAQMAEIEDYKIWELPFQKDPFDQLIEDLTRNASTKLIQNELGEYYTWYQYLNSLKDYEGVQARLPFQMKVR
jgi:protease-4